MRLIPRYPSDIFCKIGYGGLTVLNLTYTSLLFFQLRKTTGWYKLGLVWLSYPWISHLVLSSLPEVMLINSTTLTMTLMAPSRTALRGMWALVSAVQLVQQPAYLNRAHPFFLSQSGQNFGGAADTEIETWFLHLVHPLQVLNARWYVRLRQHKGLGNGALAQLS